MIRWLLNRIGVATKYDLNEYARRFLSGDDLPGSVGEYTPETAMRVATVYACVRVLAETIASLPLQVMRRLPNGGAEEAPEHPLYNILRTRANRRQTAFGWLETMVTHLALRGNHVSLKVREGRRVTQFVPVHPGNVTLEEYANDALIYVVNLRDGTQVRLVSDDVLHVPGQVTDKWWALSPVGMAKEAFSLARRVQKYGVSIFETGGAKRVLLKFPGPLGEKARENLKRSWEENGKDSARTAILEEGGDAVTVGMDADEAQYLDTRKFNRSEICGIFRVPPHMVGDLEKATYSNIQKQDLFFAKHTIRPWCKRIEAVLNGDPELIGNPRKFFVTFNLDALLRADIKERTEALKTQFMHGALTLNEWRDLENRNPTGTSEGDMHFVPMNLTPIERLAQEPVEPAVEQPVDGNEPDGGLGGDDNEPKGLLEPIARDVAGRLVNAEIRDLPRGGGVQDVQDRQRVYAYRSLRPLFEAAGIDDETRREAMATAIAEGMIVGQETAPETRKNELVGLLMGAIATDPMESLRWHGQAVAARRQRE